VFLAVCESEVGRTLGAVMVVRETGEEKGRERGRGRRESSEKRGGWKGRLVLGGNVARGEESGVGRSDSPGQRRRCL
jgi:hypothetical protein